MGGEETRVQKNAYRRRNMNVLTDYLEELVLLVSGELGQEVISEEEGGFEKIEVSDSEAVSLAVPENAVAATLQLESNDAVVNKQKVIRVKMNGADPDAATGFVYEDGVIIPVASYDGLQKFRVIGIDPGMIHTLWVQYYRSAGNQSGT